jgi:hypothetical protein
MERFRRGFTDLRLAPTDDLLRRHLTREARAQAQPVIDRQKSCHECARSKSRCDLEVPSCGRCRSRGKTCVSVICVTEALPE